MRPSFAVIFLFLLGASGAALSIYIGITGHGPTGVPLLFTEFANPARRFAVPLVIFSLSATLIIYSALVINGVVIIDYTDASEYMKAKSNLAWCGLALPFIASFAILAFNLGHKRTFIAFIAVIIYLVFFAYNWRAYKVAKESIGT